MRVMDRRPLGKSGVEVPVVGFGGAPLGNLYRELLDGQARATVQAAYDAGMRLFDTAPFYGFGLSEHRVGAALRVPTTATAPESPRTCSSSAAVYVVLTGTATNPPRSAPK